MTINIRLDLMSDKEYVSYDYSFSEKTIEDLTSLINDEVVHVYSSNVSPFMFELDQENRTNLVFKQELYIYTSDGKFFRKWKISSNPLGDTWVGFDTASICIELIKDNISAEEFQNNLKSFFNNKSIVGNIKFKISEINIYGIQGDLIRHEDNKTVYVKANIDSAIVVTTGKGDKIVFNSDGRSKVVILTIFHNKQLDTFDEWISRPKNQWNEIMLNKKVSI